MADKPKRFEAALERGTDGLGWTVVRVPFDPHTAWKTMIRLRVKGAVVSSDGQDIPFRTSLFPVPGEAGRYLILVNKRMQQAAEITAGSVAEFSLEPDLAPRPAELPDQLEALLGEEPGLREFYDSLSESMRREIGKWVLNAKSDAVILKRSEQMAERLLAAMEGEQELPPIIAAAFRMRPKAKAGWAKMTQTQRRQELLGVFYYQGIEARARRVDKLCDAAEKRSPDAS